MGRKLEQYLAIGSFDTMRLPERKLEIAYRQQLPREIERLVFCGEFGHAFLKGPGDLGADLLRGATVRSSYGTIRTSTDMRPDAGIRRVIPRERD